MMRVVRSATIGAKSRSYIRAAQAMGLSAPRIIGGHILPTCSARSWLFTTSIGVIIGAESTLTYSASGCSCPRSPGACSWPPRRDFAQAPHLLVFPVLALALAISGFILLATPRRAFGVQRDAI